MPPVLARSRTLPLTDVGLLGPLLIPSVSSKGFPLVNGLSEAGIALPLVIDDMAESLLISAYDVYHGLLIGHEELKAPERVETMYDKPTLLVLDSGGYELSETFDIGERNLGQHQAREFTRSQFESVVDQILRDRDLLVVTYDGPETDRPSYQEQYEAAARFAADHPRLRTDFLLKPPAGDSFIMPARVRAEAGALSEFDVIGVTEKELGATLLDRAECIARLRRDLDESGGAGVPLHVFGALDPLMTPTYFMSGAEIFDGLTWLRYAYYEDTAIHPDEFAVVTGSFDAGRVQRDAERYLSNLRQLGRLKEALSLWVGQPDRYELLGRHHQRLREINEIVQSRLNRGD